MDISAVRPVSANSQSGPIGTAEQTRRVLVSAVNKINESDLWPGRLLRIHMDTATHKITIQVLNSATEEVVDQIPSEEVLRLAGF